MRRTFLTLNNKKYSVNCSKYKIKWAGKSASKLEWEGKKFFYYIWKKDFCCEEFICRPSVFDSFRIDLINLDRNIAVEFHGQQHVKMVNLYHKSEDDFWKGVERDEAKKDWCIKNGIELIEVYQKNMPLSIEWLEVMYPNIEWNNGERNNRRRA